ncbi:hypothetical protein ACNOYE_33245 [Nannocystaceae bacterium ST9]
MSARIFRRAIRRFDGYECYMTWVFTLKTFTPVLLPTLALLASLAGCQDEKPHETAKKTFNKAAERLENKADRLENKADRIEDRAERKQTADERDADHETGKLDALEDKIDAKH